VQTANPLAPRPRGEFDAPLVGKSTHPVLDGLKMSDYFKSLNKKEKDRYLHKLTCADLSSYDEPYLPEVYHRPVESATFMETT